MRKVNRRHSSVELGDRLCISLCEVSDILFGRPGDRPRWYPHAAVLLEIKNGRFLTLKVGARRLAPLCKFREYVARMATVEERDRYVSDFLPNGRRPIWEQITLLELMMALRQGWDPFALA